MRPWLWVLAVLLAGCPAWGIRGPRGKSGPEPLAARVFSGKRVAVSLPGWSGAGIQAGGKAYTPDAGTERRGAMQAAVVRALEQALEEGGADAEVVLLPDMPASELAAAARARLCDVLVDLRVRRYEVSYGEPSWLLYVPALAMHYLFLAPAWVLPDERYGARLELEASCTDPQAASGALGEPAACSVEVAGTFSEWGKGWTLWGVLLHLPGGLEARNWRRVTERMEPALLAHLGRWVRTDLARHLDRSSRSWHFGKRRALIAGVGRYLSQAELPPVREAPAQARELDRILRERHGLEPFNRTLLDQEPRLQDFLGGLDLLQDRARPADATLIYFGGRSLTLETSEPALLFHDADPASGKGVLRLSDLLARAGRLRGKVVLVLDTDFSTDAAARGAAMGRAAAGPWPVSPDPDRIDVFYACSPGESAGRGAATEALIAGLDENPAAPGVWRADGDADRTICRAEIFRFLLQTVLVRQEGRQTPRLDPSLDLDDPAACPDWLQTEP